MNTLKTLIATATLAAAGTAAAAAPGVDPGVAKFLKALEGGTPIETLSPADARQVLVGAQKGAKLPPADVTTKQIQVDGKPLTIHVVKPAGSKGTLPVFMFFHGGGWVLGDFPTHERLVRDLVVESGAAAVFVDYTPSPEAKYGVAINQAYGATKWVAAHGAEIGVDGKRLAVAGNSVGGNMAAVVALMAKEQNQPKLRAQVLMWPVTDANFETGSYNAYQEGHFLTRNMMKWFWDNYEPNAAKRKEIHASPLQATTAQLQGLPPTLIQVAEFDVLRDEGEAYGRKLAAAGVPTTTVRFNGMIHDWGLLNAIADVPGTRSQVQQAGDELRRRLK